MTVNYTTNLSLGLPVTGTESGTWGDDVNNAITAYLDIAIAGGLSIPITSADVTLTNTQGTSSSTGIVSTGATGSSAQYAILNISGAKTGARNLNLPVTSKWYIINNAGTGGFALTVRGVTPTTGVTLVDGEKAIVAWNGTDYVKITTTTASGTVTSVGWTGGIVSVATATTTPALTVAGTSGGIPYFSSTSTWASSAALAANALVIGGGAGSAPSTTTTGTGVVTALGVATNASGGFPTINGTATLTNKRIDPRVTSAASASSLTPSIATADVYAYTALAANLTINAPTGTPVDGNKLLFRLLDNGVARTLTWNATYTAIGVTLPTTTTASKTTYVGCIYNAANTRWDVVAVTTQA